ncbi:unnamed protein product [Heligmosomoides polygyrus]|uniref:Transmembrane protein n=1 Tax=Heligmosomoides polygyrus TaxID=6339 RepID=A0A183GWY1_HELPZ|nr:unnamed protein product [Heligmosomoides polygyrus]
MVVTRSAAARVDRDRRERKYTYAPRSQPLLTNSVGNKYIDSYLEYDCLLTPEELSRLSEHKYSAVDISWLDELCMKDFWEYVVQFYPLWLAPNLITLIGLVVNLISVLVLSHYCPTTREVAPSWAYASAAFGLFIYQTLDATGADVFQLFRFTSHSSFSPVLFFRLSHPLWRKIRFLSRILLLGCRGSFRGFRKMQFN